MGECAKESFLRKEQGSLFCQASIRREVPFFCLFLFDPNGEMLRESNKFPVNYFLTKKINKQIHIKGVTFEILHHGINCTMSLVVKKMKCENF